MNIHSPISAIQTEPLHLPTLLRIGKLVRAYQNILLAEIGLQNGQDEFLLALQASGVISVTGLASLLGVRASTISKSTDIMVSKGKGYVVRNDCETDLRRTYLRLTAVGEAKCEAIHTIWACLEDQLFPPTAPSEERMTRAQLEALQRRVDKRLARLR